MTMSINDVYAGIDMGGTGTRFIVYGREGVLTTTTMATAALAAGNGDEKLSRLVAVALRLLPTGATLRALGLGASGPVDRDLGVINNPDTLPGFSAIPIVAELQRRLGVPVILDNDAIVAAVAEQRVGAGKNASRLLMITLGTGIGVALVLNGIPYRGHGGKHPEAGHIPISSESGECYCGIEGCWEHLASRLALQNKLRRLVPPTVIDRDVIRHAAMIADQRQVAEVFYDYGAILGRGLLAIHALYMPDLTVLGGSALHQFQLYSPGLYAALKKSNQFGAHVKIEVSALDDAGGAIGAAILAREAIT